ncbi:MAG: patatin-like phospholipase family protein [Gammaproteobacteria bacterium]|nr:patatin-like phospholipase family protein [Gammaproteobacteria bacterium]MDH4314435.1 patatin-like phospholipase family protein [Gammaproteobacteria bacterium]MDH5213284.1 patatin-like phospholipase family protein [Gammaproteobacteria bacterium]MDH5622040.1 patatin-like phospholipase family protein [Gammaproteobacteria bacterium]
MSKKPESVSLVLGSGGARGHAHIGVIRAIEERKLSIRSIAGTSMGAVIGGIYAAQELDTYIKWVMQLRKSDVVKLLDFSFTWTSIFKGERIIEVLKQLIGDRQIEELPIAFTAVATAIEEQREVWLNKGSLFTAIKASTAVPGAFSPVTINGRILVDGGLVNPIPIAPTMNDATDVTIAVNLSGITDHFGPAEEATPEKPKKEDQSYRAAIGRFVSNLLESDDEPDEPPGAVDLLTQSIDVMQGSIARLKLAAYAPDIVVDVPRDACSFFEFHRAEEMADIGYRNTVKALDKARL